MPLFSFSNYIKNYTSYWYVTTVNKQLNTFSKALYIELVLLSFIVCDIPIRASAKWSKHYKL